MSTQSDKQIAAIDVSHLRLIRQNVSFFIAACAATYDRAGGMLLDIAPQVHEGASPYFTKSKIETLDIEKSSGATYIADLCETNNDSIPGGRFDFVVCTEVLEHTLRPFNAVDEIERILKPGGLAFVTVPFNFRIHGPLPDCWRFTEHGLRAIFASFKIVELKEIPTEDRFLMPVHYTLIAAKKD